MTIDFRTETTFGYTTGACAVSGAYSALYFLKNNKKLDFVEILNLKNETLIIPIQNIERSENTAFATVKKFSGKDIDITNNMTINVEVTLQKLDNNSNLKLIEIFGGNGVGIVTKRGLQIDVGDYAINPKPREMIEKNLISLLNDGEKAVVRISIPNGDEISKKTLNPKLGIIGGISILGTTGIVRPMSNDAYKESLLPQIDIAIQNGFENLVFVPGNIGTKYAKSVLNIEEDQIIEVSNFWGFMLEKAGEKGVKDITVFGHAGKIVKLAGGIFDTHSKVSDARNEILCAYTSTLCNNQELMKKILQSNTTEEIIEILAEKDILNEVFNLISKRVVERLCLRFPNIKFSCIIVDINGKILGKCFLGDRFD
ncbi:cobalamin biosynthesis protein CbiD [Methanococcus vannielii SB]|uniref:Cobalt-precorrin-5B C(1)-methyltransferase n=1 Tax=Methanococcus vannielii (strain ATCC 35089 / DSM 1224 / JCM 13029 / OCM 148 / SB) TaxID=406327 RepID=CBID_METVS|nr:cobalt-precorrin-5B (C(1))-methyltransferase CbiD [Methanococcus vannielii]A6UPK3.1 RecName: Full=Cobalt-precorrin-5B C(1)-methyltransferase; AltName: Full=Cobalt-precorrin-6A synthase [Methanococcus vannielii SB]ABR54425.1 cobalamin biosynthesis protein CbiD [Methanococcus vannielii SB]